MRLITRRNNRSVRGARNNESIGKLERESVFLLQVLVGFFQISRTTFTEYWNIMNEERSPFKEAALAFLSFCLSWGKGGGGSGDPPPLPTTRCKGEERKENEIQSIFQPGLLCKARISETHFNSSQFHSIPFNIIRFDSIGLDLIWFEIVRLWFIYLAFPQSLPHPLPPSPFPSALGAFWTKPHSKVP